MTAAIFQDPLATTPAPHAAASRTERIPAVYFTAPGAIDESVHTAITQKAQRFHAAEVSTFSPSKPTASAKDEIAAELAAALAGAKPLKASR